MFEVFIKPSTGKYVNLWHRNQEVHPRDSTRHSTASIKLLRVLSHCKALRDRTKQKMKRVLAAKETTQFLQGTEALESL